MGQGSRIVEGRRAGRHHQLLGFLGKVWRVRVGREREEWKDILRCAELLECSFPQVLLCFETHHSRSKTERDSTTSNLPSSFSAPSRLCRDVVPERLTTSVTSFNFSLASARLSAGFFVLGGGRAGTGTACRLFRMQNIHKLHHRISSA